MALAKILLENQTHLIGTLRKNRAGNLKVVADTHLKKDEVIGCDNEDGTVVAKWKSKSEVLMLSTKHDLKMVDTRRNRCNEKVMRPEIIMCYNKGKQGINISDQMANYFTPPQKILT